MNLTFAVEIRNLTRRFGAFTAVDALTFHVAPGEVFGFLGANGSGKTTTIRMLCGLLKPPSGTGRVLDFDISRETEAIKARIGYMSQQFSLYDDLTVSENLQFYADVYGLPRRERAGRIAELIVLAAVQGREHEQVRNLSGGWKRRVALACALVHQSRVLFLDEPTSGVDPQARPAFWDLIYALAQEGVTIFVTTHFLDEVERCNRIALLASGRLVALDTPPNLKAHAIQGEVLEVEGTPQEQARAQITALPDVRDVAPYGARLHVVVDDAAQRIEPVRVALDTAGIGNAHVQRIEPSLEDVFVAVLGGAAFDTAHGKAN